MTLTKERWVVMDASASLDGQYEEVACCYCLKKDTFFWYLDIYPFAWASCSEQRFIFVGTHSPFTFPIPPIIHSRKTSVFYS